MSLPLLPHAWGGPAAKGSLKATPEDFVVEELLGFDPSGEGEHIFLRVEKTGENTDHLARQIARHAEVPRQAVSYAGMKDRNARTIQWYSVQVPGKREIDWSGLESERVRVLETRRNSRKLRTGALRGNRFEIVLRDLDGSSQMIEQRLRRIATDGVPNYFGPQRFGHGGRNLEQALAMFSGELKLRDRNLAGIYLSAARSHVFNAVLARRVVDGNWNEALPGDVFMFGDSHSFFREALNEDIQRRIEAREIHPSGPLWGKGELPTSESVGALESEVAEPLRDYCDGLVRAGLEMARRPLRLCVSDLAWRPLDGSALQVSFALPAGAYATSVLREAADFQGELD